MESQSEESERFHFFQTYDSVAYDPVKTRLSDSEAKGER